MNSIYHHHLRDHELFLLWNLIWTHSNYLSSYLGIPNLTNMLHNTSLLCDPFALCFSPPKFLFIVIISTMIYVTRTSLLININKQTNILTDWPTNYMTSWPTKPASHPTNWPTDQPTNKLTDWPTDQPTTSIKQSLSSEATFSWQELQRSKAKVSQEYRYMKAFTQVTFSVPLQLLLRRHLFYWLHYCVVLGVIMTQNLPTMITGKCLIGQVEEQLLWARQQI
jgi:hypothetical protein